MRRGIILRLATICFIIAVFISLTGTGYLADETLNSVQMAYVSVTTGSDTTGNGSQGNPWASITKAVSSFVGNSTNPYEIHVAQGTYYENEIKPGIYESILGGYSPITWERDIAANLTVIDANGGETILWGKDNCTIDGLTLKNAIERGVFCFSSSPIISHCRIINCGKGISTAQSAIIENNILEGNGYGIFGSNIESSDTIIRNNLILLSSGDTGTAAIASISNNMQCINNTIDGGSRSGIRILRISSQPSPIVLIQNNNVTNNNDDGIYLSDSEITGVDPTLITIRYNNVWNNNANYDGYASPGVGDISEDPLYIMPLVSSSIADSNLTYGPSSNDAADSSLAQMAEMERECDLRGSSAINTATRPKSTYLSADYDYHLLPSSPSINKGTNEDAPSDDLDGNTRPYPSDGNVDIGCYEYYGELPPTVTPISPTPTPSVTPIPPTATPTATPIHPTATPTITPIRPTATPTVTPISPTVTPIPPTVTPIPPTATPQPEPTEPEEKPIIPDITPEPGETRTPPSTQADISLNGSSFNIGEHLVASFTLNETISQTFNAYAVIIFPDGTMLNLMTMSPKLKPIVTKMRGLSAPFSCVLLSADIPQGALSGEYTIIVAFFEPGKLISARTAFLLVSGNFRVN